MNVFVISVSLLISAASPAEPTGLAQLIRRFSARSPELGAIKARFDSQRYAVREAIGEQLPDVSAQAQGFDQQNVMDMGAGLFSVHRKNYSAELVVVQPIYTGGDTVRLRSRERNLGEIDYKIGKNRIIGNFVRAFAEHLHAKEVARVLRESEKTYRQFFEITRRKRRSGAALPYELDQARADVLSYESRVRTADQRHESTGRHLRSLLQVDPEFPVVFDWPKVTGPQGGGKNVTSRPEWKRAKAELEIAEAQKEMAIAQDLPSVHVQATYGYQSSKWDTLGDDETEAHSFGVVVNVPLFSGLSGVHRWRGAEKLRESAERNFRAVERDSQVELKNADDRSRAAVANLVSSQNAAESAKRALESGLNNFKVGRINLFQVVQLQSAFERSELARIDAQREALMAEMDWATTSGMDLETFYK